MEPLEKIRYLRFINKESQKDVANAIGISTSNYCYYENGKWKFNLEHIKKIADHFNVSLSYLLEEEKEDILITKDQLDKLIEAKKVIEQIEESYIKTKKE